MIWFSVSTTNLSHSIQLMTEDRMPALRCARRGDRTITEEDGYDQENVVIRDRKGEIEGGNEFTGTRPPRMDEGGR